MKKLLVLLISLFFGSGMLASVSAQSVQSPFFAKTVFIQKITSTKEGYIVVYLDDRLNPHTSYIPIQWFYKSTGATSDGFAKAEILYGNGPQFPYMQIFWKDGKFHHLRIFAERNLNSPSWGILSDTADTSGLFHPNQEIDFKFER